MNKKQKRMLLRILIAAACILLIEIITRLMKVPGWVRFAAYMIPYCTIGYDILLRAWKGIRKRQVFDENFLMAVATVGAILIGEYVEGVAVMLFYQIGELFQSYAVGRSRASIGALMDIRPDVANVELEDGTTEETDPDDVEIGTILLVRPGEKIPIDGVVISGSSSLDTSALTGESVPRTAKEGDEVLSGMINMTGVLRIRTTKEFGESTASKILELVENASSRKSRSENFISRFARYYTPAVCYSALALAVLPPMVRLILGQEAMWSQWLLRALTFLVISCPCALVISIPLGFFAGIGGAGRAGVLVKGSVYLESLSKVKTMVFDKTGTLTQGVFEVTEMAPVGTTKDELLEMAAYAEYHSNHPIALSLKEAYRQEIRPERIGAVEDVSGEGLIADVDGHEIAVGNLKLMQRVKVAPKENQHPGTVVYVAKDEQYLGSILISDRVKENAQEALRRLKKAGVERTVMLTGDRRQAGEAVAKALGIDEVRAELMPQDKVEQVEAMLRDGKTLAFVGDGINDAPVLMRADIGIAMGALGSDAAIEAADIVLMDDDPLKISKAIRIARKCMRIVYENIIFAIGVKLICLGLGAFGIAGMWLAIFADVGVMVLAVLNAIRTLRVKNL
ncbi:MAG: cadmium-translocating P-type ATPase [Clostridiales bacterium]|nr:cadmium-translocating P-type ATPase [Clostridiales bacterium]